MKTLRCRGERDGARRERDEAIADLTTERNAIDAILREHLNGWIEAREEHPEQPEMGPRPALVDGVRALAAELAEARRLLGQEQAQHDITCRQAERHTALLQAERDDARNELAAIRAAMTTPEGYRGVVADAVAEEREVLVAELAEARAELANERGRGPPPSEGWTFIDNLEDYNGGGWARTTDGPIHAWTVYRCADDDEPVGFYCVFRGDTKIPGRHATARKAMRAADLAIEAAAAAKEPK